MRFNYQSHHFTIWNKIPSPNSLSQHSDKHWNAYTMFLLIQICHVYAIHTHINSHGNSKLKGISSPFLTIFASVQGNIVLYIFFLVPLYSISWDLSQFSSIDSLWRNTLLATLVICIRSETPIFFRMNFALLLHIKANVLFIIY